MSPWRKQRHTVILHERNESSYGHVRRETVLGKNGDPLYETLRGRYREVDKQRVNRTRPQIRYISYPADNRLREGSSKRCCRSKGCRWTKNRTNVSPRPRFMKTLENIWKTGGSIRDTGTPSRPAVLVVPNQQKI